ncbi:MAG: thiamine pyrophosphate-binding protein [Clostridia bacterium]|nr:thiamine pyrophosphate-binding protein [Clostridia bacterium]
MKIRLADYVAQFLSGRGVTDCFTVVGGGAMHLNDALGHHPGIKCTYQHHEQACAIAAEAYARLDNRAAVLCVTTGPGGTNALTGVVGAYLDSIPMFVLSGQVRYDTTARYAMRFTDGLPLRAVGDQEYDIVKSVAPMTKYAVMIEDPLTIRYHMERAWHLMRTGRPGPVWLDIPVNFQGMTIETEDLTGYDPAGEEPLQALPPKVEDSVVREVLSLIRKAKRPVIYAGGGIRLSGAYALFRRLLPLLGVPVATYWNAIDLIEDDDPLYVGRAGNMGDRAGNYAVQNSDLLLAIGTRISIRQTGYNFGAWAKYAKVIMVDIDRAEMKKPTLHVDMPIWADAKDFLEVVARNLTEEAPVSPEDNWREQCRTWKAKYPVVLPRQKAQAEGYANVYAAIQAIASALPQGSLTAVSNGACCVAGHQAWVIKRGTRFIINSAIASMGYGLPAAIGLCIAGGRRQTVCMEGDGSIMMNLQELQTIVTYRLPIRIFLINNGGYHSIRLTQSNLFSEHTKVGIGPESGDLGFPDFGKLAAAFGLPYFAAHSNREVETLAERLLSIEGPVLCEIFTDTQQVWEPKSSARKLPDGSLVSPPLEDLAPFLDRDEVKSNLYIPVDPSIDAMN